MPPKAPHDPQQALRAEMEKEGVTVTALARCLGVSRQQVYNLLRGRRMTAAQAVLLERAFDIPASQWLALQVEVDIADARASLAAANDQRKRAAR